MESAFVELVIDTVERTARGRRGLGRKTAVFAATLVAFIASGLWVLSLEELAMIVVVVFVHELGHLVAMRFFGYRDLQLACIPFIGGVTTGLAVRLRASQAVVVALLGPLPGLLIGLLLALAGQATGSSPLLRWSVAFVAINGINLLPIYPLDGGRVMQELVFRRRPLLDMLAKVWGALALAVVAFVSLCLPAGLAVLAAVYVAWWDFTSARRGRRFRHVARAVCEQEAAVPVDYVLRVMPEIRSRSGSLASDPDHVAGEIVVLWQHSVYRQASLLSSVGLLLAYFGAAMLAIIGAVTGLTALAS
jgi:Zn-dependent protease